MPRAVAAALLFVELLLAGWAESKRLADYNNPGSQGDGSFFGITDGLKGQDNGYPGQVPAFQVICAPSSLQLRHVVNRLTESLLRQSLQGSPVPVSACSDCRSQ